MILQNSDLKQVDVNITVVLGTAMMQVHQLLRISRGAVIGLDAHENDDVIIMVNNQPIAKGTVMVEAGKIGVAVTKMLKYVPGARHLD